MNNRTYTEQDVIELFNGDQVDIFKKVAEALNSGFDVGMLLKKTLADMEAELEAIELHEYIVSGQAEEDRRNEAWEMQHDCY